MVSAMVQQTQQLYEQVVQELRARLVAELGTELEAVVLYGAVARGEANEDSDIDLLIIARNKRTIYNRIFDITFEIDLKYETLTTFILHTPEEFRDLCTRGEPLLQEVLRVGKAIYGKEKLRRYQRALQTG